MKYQDTWINGRLIEKGIRECDFRYSLIKKIAMTLESSFVVCDIGANMNYFGNRLLEDFNCKVISFEYSDFKNRDKIINKQKTNNLMYVNRKIKLNDIILLDGIIKFDLILALSILHHVSEPLDEWICALRKISNNLIIEFASEDARKKKKKNLNYSISDYKVLGYCNSHINVNIKRKIVLFK